ncbi:MAG TPA: ABC transporter permease [Thermoplasmata archaeon]
MQRASVLTKILPGKSGDKDKKSSVRSERLRLAYKKTRRTWKLFRSNRLGILGFLMLISFIVMAIIAQPLHALGLISDPNDLRESINPGRELEPPSAEHLLGTDEKGRDVISDLFYGCTATLIVGFAAALLTIVFGSSVGLLAGASGKIADEVLMRTTDLFLVIPWLPLAIILAAFLPPKGEPAMLKVIFVIGVTSWPATARIVRSQVLSIKERSYIERAVCLGSSRLHIMRVHLLPNVFPLIFANAIISVAWAILSAAFLAFLNLTDPNKITWGLMIYNAFDVEGFGAGAWWFVLPPGILIVLVVLGFTFVSYALDDILNPKLRRR